MIADKYLGETLALANHLVFDCLLPEKKKSANDSHNG